MKFTAKQAVEALTAMIDAKDKDLDLSRTITENVENGFKMVGDNETMELADFTKLVYPFVATAAGLAHKNASTATKTLQERIAELEKQVNRRNQTQTTRYTTDDCLLDRIASWRKTKPPRQSGEMQQRIKAVAKQGDNEGYISE